MDKKSIAKRSHANVRSDFRNQTFARERLAVDFLVQGLGGRRGSGAPFTPSSLA